MDEGGRAGRLNQVDGERDSHAGEGTQNQGDEDEELGVQADAVDDTLVSLPVALGLRQDEEEAAAGEVSDEDVPDGDRGY